MQILGLTDSMPRSDGRLKSLFWPSVQTANDVDYLGTQGYWVCAVVAVFSFILLTVMGHLNLAAITFLFYFLGGVGVRERSPYAAGLILVMFVLDVIFAPSIPKVLITALLVSNLRATWIASRWKPESDEAVAPPRFADTWSDKFSDSLPPWLWPKVRFPYYVCSALLLLLVGIGLVTKFTHRAI